MQLQLSDSTEPGTDQSLGHATAYDSNQARLDDLDRWLHHYHHHRPHMALNGDVPMSLVNNVPARHT